MCAHSLGYQTIETMTCKELEFPQESHSSREGKTRVPWQPAREISQIIEHLLGQLKISIHNQL